VHADYFVRIKTEQIKPILQVILQLYDGQIQLPEKLEQAENKQHIIDCLNTKQSHSRCDFYAIFSS
jgi:hypothetical protein